MSASMSIRFNDCVRDDVRPSMHEYIDRPRFLSEADCHDLIQRLSRFTAGGGYTSISVISRWVGNVRWGRNQISTSGETSDNSITVQRNIRGALGRLEMNDTTDAALVAAARRTERLAVLEPERENSDLIGRMPIEVASHPSLFDEATYHLDAQQRSATAHTLAEQARQANLLSAGYIAVTAVAIAILDTLGRVRYFPYTQAQCSLTVRDPSHTGSGWAGVDGYAWNKIDTSALTAIAMDKCLKSRNPVAIEPGRYTTILEPQAVSDFVGKMVRRAYGDVGDYGDFQDNQRSSQPGPFWDPATEGSKLGQRVVDERITISADPQDPDLGFWPFAPFSYEVGDPFVAPVYSPVTWIEQGVLTNLSFQRQTAINSMGLNSGMPNSGAFRMTGGNTSVDEMIATTKRGVLVTRFDSIILAERTSQLYRGYTRDGFWLIENGKISKAIKNMAFTESVLAALNKVDQLGPPQRVFNPWVSKELIPQPAIVPALKVRDFSFTALADAV